MRNLNKQIEQPTIQYRHHTYEKQRMKIKNSHNFKFCRKIKRNQCIK
ncbi:unnamed protein product [Paramecium sonneborni]|uniref:Uncharacterized protein n=1 Tax=Paramecium sonneborni TaxID=65129 RepID=A0A8S1QVC0_9CILI|nr:unnamed protein product [Paramecium sonneborni]